MAVLILIGKTLGQSPSHTGKSWTLFSLEYFVPLFLLR